MIYSKTIAGKHGHISPIFSNCCIQKLTADTYLNLNSGEIKEFQKQDKKDVHSLMGAKQKCIDIIHANLTPSSLFLTVTTRENIQDRDRYFLLMSKFKKTDIFRECFGGSYLYTVEKQKRGALHSHFICFNPLVERLPYKKLIEAWCKVVGGIRPNDKKTKYKGLGSVCIKKIDNPDNIGKYLAKYILKEFASVAKHKRVYVPSKLLKQPDKSLIKDYEACRLIVQHKATAKKAIIDGEERIVSYYW